MISLSATRWPSTRSLPAVLGAVLGVVLGAVLGAAVAAVGPGAPAAGAATAAASTAAAAADVTAQWAGCGPAPTGKVAVALVVDSPSGLSTRCVSVPVGATGADVLAAAGSALRAEQGFLCGIDGVPATGCALSDPSADYWSYWHAPPGGSWMYSSLGAFGYRLTGRCAVEGWRYVGASVPKSQAAPRAAPPPVTCETPEPAPTAPTSGGTATAPPAPGVAAVPSTTAAPATGGGTAPGAAPAGGGGGVGTGRSPGRRCGLVHRVGRGRRGGRRGGRGRGGRGSRHRRAG